MGGVSLFAPASAGIVRITAKRQHWTKNVERLCSAELTPLGRHCQKHRHWTKNVERLCDTELAPLGEGGGAVQLEIFAAVEMPLLIEMIVYG